MPQILDLHWGRPGLMRDMANIEAASMAVAIEFCAASGRSQEKQQLEAAGAGSRPTSGIQRPK